MGDEDGRDGGRVGALRRRRATLADGRYLIYFTFDAGAQAPPAEGQGARAEPEAAAAAGAESTEERRV